MSNKWLRGLLWAGAGLAGMAIINAEIARRVDPLDPAGSLDGEPNYYQWSLGRVFYTVAGQGAPLILIHGFEIGMDSQVWSCLFKQLSQKFRVYAYDQLGFGLSDRPDITYNAELYVRLQRDFVRDVVRGPATAVADDGLACAHTVLAASLYPTLFENLILIHPVTMRGWFQKPDWQWGLVHTLLRSPVLGEMLVNIIASRSSIRGWLGERLFMRWGREDENLVDAHYTSSHQPGARHAIAAYISGLLELDIRLAFARLQQPVTIVWGRGDRSLPSERIEYLLDLNPSARMVALENTGPCVAYECPDELVRVIESAMGSGNRGKR